jgi:hypothetical protein
MKELPEQYSAFFSYEGGVLKAKESLEAFKELSLK